MEDGLWIKKVPSSDTTTFGAYLNMYPCESNEKNSFRKLDDSYRSLTIVGK